MAESVGFPEAVSMAVGGMVGGGIFAVLGVVAATAGTAAWLAFVAAGVLAGCAGYSFVRLMRATSGDGGPIAQIEDVTGARWIAGLTGWVFTFGYVGTMAMYAYAFGSYALELLGVHAILGLPARPVVSVVAVAGFTGLNALGARASGRTEDALVVAKVCILLVLGGGGIWYGLQQGTIDSGLSNLGGGAVSAAAMSFVAFEGWELLTFDLDSIEGGGETVRRAIYTSIVFTTFLYILVAVTTTNLVSTETIQAHAETALAYAARPFLHETGFVLVAVAAVLSTASALNATLFSASRLTQQVADTTQSREGSATTQHHRGGNGGTTVRSLFVLGTLTALLTAYGSLESVTSFASGAFITIFGGVSAIAYTTRDDLVSTVVPALGAVGAVVGLLGLFWHLHRSNPSVLVSVAMLWAVVLTLYWVPRRT